jgi:uncharacterized membrane protein (Fun14 family)
MGRKPKNTTPPDPGQPERSRRRGRPIPLWQKALLAVSVLLMLGGGAAWAYATLIAPKPKPAASVATPSPTPGASGLTDTGVSGFGPGFTLPGQTPDAPEPTPEASDRPIDLYSPAVFRLGFSFFAGFAMAYALRQFVKVTLVVAGVILLGMFGLQYAGLIDVNWSAIEGKYDSIAGFFRRETESFTKFVSGYLPSATSAAAGAFIGFRKK